MDNGVASLSTESNFGDNGYARSDDTGDSSFYGKQIISVTIFNFDNFKVTKL